MHMNKKGQVTVFVILGIVIIGVIGLLYYAISKNYVKVPFVSSGTVSVQDHVEECITEKGNEAIVLIGQQGGDITPSLYQNWCVDSENCYKVSYLCYTSTPLQPCLNRRPFLKQHMEKEIKTYIDAHLQECVDVDLWRDSGYSVSSGSYESKVFIDNDDTLITVDWPLTVTKGEFTQTQDHFSHEFKVPLGRISDTAYEVVDSEIQSGDLMVVPYVVRNRGNIEVDKHRVGNTKVYILNTFKNDYKFYFAVAGYSL